MIAWITGWKPLAAKVTPPSTVASSSSWISDSTIITASSVPATIRSILLAGSFTWSMVGFSTYSPSMKPTRAAPMGPMKGAPESVRAALAATMATMSGSFSRSWLSTVQMTWTSFLKPLTNRGRTGRSIRRLVSVSFSEGRPSRLKKPPGILPAAKVFSW